jgi:hypothetical protein
MGAFEKRIEETADDEERSKLQSVVTSMREVGQAVMVAVLSDVIRRHGL